MYRKDGRAWAVWPPCLSPGRLRRAPGITGLEAALSAVRDGWAASRSRESPLSPRHYVRNTVVALTKDAGDEQCEPGTRCYEVTSMFEAMDREDPKVDTISTGSRRQETQYRL